MSVGTGIDLVFLLLILISVWRGWMLGLVIKLAQLASLVAAAFAARIVAHLLADGFSSSVILPLLEKNMGADMGEVPLAEEAVRLVADNLACGLIYLLVFIVVLLVLRKLLYLLKIVDYIPVVGTINKLGGAAAGFFVAFAELYILCFLFFQFVPEQTLVQMGLTEQAVSQTYLLRVFAK